MIRDAMDRRLSGLDFDDRMMSRLSGRLNELEGQTMQRRFGRPALLIAALILLLLAAGALAAAVFSGSVDWFGNPVETVIVEPTPRPDPTDAAWALEARMADLIAEKPEDEIWYFRYADGKGEMSPAEERVISCGDLEKRLKNAASPLALPAIPEDYRFIRGSLQFYYTQENLQNLIPLGEEAPEESVTLSKFRATDALKACVFGYDAQFQDGKGNRLWAMANLDSMSTDWSFGVNEGEVYEAVPVAGMKNALYVGSGVGGTLHLLKAGIAPIRVLDAFAPVSADQQDGAEVYDSIVYMLSADALGKDALAAMAEGMS
jgi:hypothetical protein